MDNLIPKKRGSYWQLLHASIRLYKASLLRIAPLSLLLAITTFLPRLLSDIINVDLLSYIGTDDPNQLWLLVVSLAALIFFIGIIWRMHCIIIDKHEPLIEDLVIGIKKFYLAFFANIAGAAAFFASGFFLKSLAVIVPKIGMLFGNNTLNMIFTFIMIFAQMLLILYVAFLFIFLLPLIAVENQGIISSLRRSARLTWNHWWSVITLQTTPWICYLLALVIIKNIFHIEVHIYLFEQASPDLLTTLFHVLLFAIFIPWVAALLLIQMHDLEIRNKTPYREPKKR